MVGGYSSLCDHVRPRREVDNSFFGASLAGLVGGHTTQKNLVFSESHKSGNNQQQKSIIKINSKTHRKSLKISNS